MQTVSRRRAMVTIAIAALAGGAVTGVVMATDQERTRDGFDEFKPAISKVSVQQQAKSDIRFVIEGIEKDLGKRLSADDAKRLESYYIEQTVETIGKYYRFKE